MRRTFLTVSAMAVALATTPVLAQQGAPNTGTVNMGHPIQVGPRGGEVWRRPGGGGPGRGWQGGGRGRGDGWRGGGGWRGDGGWRHRHRGGDYGAALGGLAAGALIGGAIAAQAAPDYDYGYAPPPPPPPGDDAVGYCMQQFKSYDPGSGTYLGYDGLRHPCP